MLELKQGQQIGIPCDVKPGAFPGEYLVTFDTESGPVSGFVKDESLSQSESGTLYLQAVVEEVTDTTVTVHVRGSFFTTTGLAYFSRDWAKSNLEIQAA